MLIFTNEAIAGGHRTPSGHPERAARMRAVREALDEGEAASWPRQDAPAASRSILLRAHSGAHVAAITRASERAEETEEPVALDPDTWVAEGTQAAALAAAGGAAAGVDAVIGAEAEKAFVACRPPGHHAERDRAMGFCLFSNIAVAAKHAVEVHGLQRVAVVDFDVHHGNGSQAILDDDARCFFSSSHQSPLFPGSGADEGLNRPDVVNMPLPAGFDGAAFRHAWTEIAAPALDAFKPELILVSAGFDAHARDPLAQGMLEASDFAWIGASLREWAQGAAKGRVVAALEGGYDLLGLYEGLAAFLGGLSGGRAAQ